MRPLTSRELLDVWERSLGKSSVERALVWLRAASENETEDPAALAIGERDARLLALREWTFGPELNGVSNCPSCGSPREFTASAAELREGTTAVGPLLAQRDGYEVEFRLPDSRDLSVAESEPDADSAGAVLVRRCVAAVRRDGQPVDAEDLPDEVIRAVSAGMADADPRAEIEFPLQCDSCGERWEAAFDILSFFWSELQAWAGRMVNEAHQLAAAYGWSEEQILALSPVRRHLYLTLIAE